MPLSPIPNYPGSLDSLPDPTAATYEDDDGFEIDYLLQKHNAILEALEAKLGIGASLAARGKALIASGAGGGIWDTFQRKNKVRNGGMRVKQRAVLGSTDNSYTLDGWRVLMEGATACVVTQETTDVPADGSKRAIKLTVGAANNLKFGIFQVIEFLDAADLRAKLTSIQAKIRATAGITDVRMAVLDWTGAADATTGDPISAWGTTGNPTLAAGWAYLGTPTNLAATTSWLAYGVDGSLQGAFGASTNNVGVFVWNNDQTTTTTTDALLVTDVQLEEGAVRTDVERMSYRQALAECQRYYFEMPASGNSYAFGAGWNESTTAHAFYMNYPQMRANPTLGNSAASFFNVYGPAGATNCTALAAVAAGLDRGLFRATVASGLTVNQPGHLVAVNANAIITLSAEI